MEKEKVHAANRNDLLKRIQSYKKLDYEQLSKENLCLQSYLKSLNLSDSRLFFAIRCKMTRTVQMNFKGDRHFAANKWKCVSCGLADTQEHLLHCSGYSYLRQNKNLSNVGDMNEYFRSIIRVRDEMVSLTAPAQSSRLVPV